MAQQTARKSDHGIMPLWRRVTPDWKLWLDILEGIAGKQKTFTALCHGPSIIRANIRHSLLGGMHFESPKEDGPHLYKAFRRLGVVRVCGRKALLAIPSDDFDHSRFIGFVACGREPDWSNFRQQSCIRIVTEAVAGRLPIEVGEIGITVGTTEQSPLLFACCIFARAETKIDKLLQHSLFMDLDPDDRSEVGGLVSWDKLREVVGLAAPTT